MFVSFFPKPKLFFISLVIWSAICIAAWYLGGRALGDSLGFASTTPGAPIIGPQRFWSGPFLWFYIYFASAVAIFAAIWSVLSPHPYQRWSVLGSALITFIVYFQVEVSVAFNDWYGPFYDLVQAALSKAKVVEGVELYGYVISILGIAAVYITVVVFNRFFVSHYIFRWRTSMNDYYMEHWPRLRNIEGASQRVQDDTMRFANISESLGVNLLDAIMTLIAFMPVLLKLSENVTELPLIGHVPYALVWVSIIWAFFGTAFLAIIGIKLPGLNFRNQRVEAAYRKELVYGEDDSSRADPQTARELFSNVRKNYFRMYFHYLYFNVGRYFYIQADNIFPWLILVPTIVAGKIALGALNQILNAFEQVRNSFQYLVNSWTTIIELLSIYKRLRAFEAQIHGEALPAEDIAYLAAKSSLDA